MTISHQSTSEGVAQAEGAAFGAGCYYLVSMCAQRYAIAGLNTFRAFWRRSFLPNMSSLLCMGEY